MQPDQFITAWFRLVFLTAQLPFVFSVSHPHQTNIPVTIQTKVGQIRGFESIFLHRRVRSFLSVPFAEPPTGELRFKPPIPKQKWNNTLETQNLSPACYQARDPYNESFWGSEMWNYNTENTEDCLYLNIWTPAEVPYNLTVLVWIFGGGFWYGSPSLNLYDGRALALTGNVIVVNINYRVGPFGYLYFNHPDAPGNIGMLDQQLALQWIRDNIEAFGGNPNSISLFGESAGASSIVAHLIAPGSRGLFKNGILQSGSLDNQWSVDTPARALEKSMQLARLVGCNQTLTDDIIVCMRARPAADLTANIWNLNLNFLEFPFVIVSQDPNFFREYDAYIALHKKQFDQTVNLMIGINHDEGNFWNIYNLKKYFDVPEQPLLTLDNFNDCINTAFSRLSEVVRDAASYVYLGEKCDYISGKSKFLAEQINQMVGDFYFKFIQILLELFRIVLVTCDSLWLADQMAEGPGNVYIYYFDQPSSANPWPSWTGVMHGYEIEYVFGAPTYNVTAGYTNREKVLSSKMMQFWTTFAATGTPSLRVNKETEEWPRYHPETNRRWMHLKGGSHIRPIPASKERECRVWRAEKEMDYHKYLLPMISTANSLRLTSAWAVGQLLVLLLIRIVV